jgi:hypothetical protein
MKGPKQKGEVADSPTASTSESTEPKKPKKVVKRTPGLAKNMVWAKKEGVDEAVKAGFRIGLPVFYPTAKIAGATYPQNNTRAYRMTTADGKRASAYRIVAKLSNSNGDYYGVQGVYWTDPPILKNPSETRRIKGRDYNLYYEGSKLGLVSFQREGASYWVSNTLARKLSEKQMLSVATSLRMRK